MSAALALQLKDYRLTTAEILYHMPDHPHLLQSYVWQDYDISPEFPQLRRFLDFWSQNLDGKLHSVKMDSQKLIGQSELRRAECMLSLH